jgi:hypothetical protein
MKINKVPKSAITLLIIGLLLTTSFTPILSHYFPLPDFVKGFITGLGLTFEVFAIIKMQQSKKKVNCISTNN